jgi:rhodanese-related sulfurtransferase
MSQRFFSIAPEQLHQRMQSDRPATVVDVRSQAEYRAGHVRGATSVPLDEMDTSDLIGQTGNPSAGSDQPLYLTCHSGLRAQQAAEKLHSAGYDNIVLLQGGTEAWEKSGLPMRRIGNAISLERQVQITIGTLLILKVVFGFTVHEVFFVLAALIGAGLITAGVTRWCGMARLISRMPWNQTNDSARQTAG